MANGQPLGAGDGPENPFGSGLNAGSPWSWTNLPLSVSVFRGIESEIDIEGLRLIRLVCKEMQKNVENCAVLKVKVDDSLEGNLEFVKRVKVGDARILNWTEDIGTEPSNRRLFLYPDWLKKLKLCGKMPAQWKIHDLRHFPSLAHLVLRDLALHSNNLTGHQFPVVNSIDPASELSAEEALTQAYQTQDPPSESRPIELKSLQTLEIIRYDYDEIIATTELPTNSYLAMMTNICFILSHVRSPLLSVVQIAVSLPAHVLDHFKLNQKLVHLYKFLESHRTSLRQLILPSLNAKSSELIDKENFSNYSFPIYLHKLELDLERPWWSLDSKEESADQPNFTYLQTCLQRQTQLQDVNFNFESFPTKCLSDVFTWLANSCGRTLRYLELSGSVQENTTTPLDLQMLSVCQCLQSLYIRLRGWTSVTFRNLDKLPTSLKILVINCYLNWSFEDSNFLKRLTALEWLSLSCILLPSTSNNAGNQKSERDFCRKMVKCMLGMRQLKGFNLFIQQLPLNWDRILGIILGSLDPEINPGSRRPINYASFNFPLDNQLDSLTDKPFDRNTWNLEKYEDDVKEPRHLTPLGTFFRDNGFEVNLNAPVQNAADVGENEDVNEQEVENVNRDEGV